MTLGSKTQREFERGMQLDGVKEVSGRRPAENRELVLGLFWNALGDLIPLRRLRPRSACVLFSNHIPALI